MNEKVGRNDPCPCGSGKKYKQCCLLKKGPGGKRKISAKWLNAPAGPNLIERTYGGAIEGAGKQFAPANSPEPPEERTHSE
jgi:hypothetical protein